jgi:hypothetical protein
MASLVRWIAIRQISPRGARSQDPEDSVENGAAVLPRTTAAIFAARWLWDERLKGIPLPIGKIMGMVGWHVDTPLMRRPALRVS